MWHPLILLACAAVSCALAGRPAQRYLPSNQYLAPHPNQLHYHGVSGQSRGAIGGGGVRGGVGGHRQAQIPIVRSDYESDTSGNYNFGFDTGNGIHRDETGEFKGGWPHGSLGVRGSYSYTGDDGQQYTVNYKADKNGFQAEGAHLPTSPSLPNEHHQHRSGSSAGAYHGGAYHGSASSVQPPSSRYLPPSYRQRRHY
ncbi:cuticle protein 2 [Drosophila hydei]|uniref:Cuticle protein 2 n=1 Tax=Drosophila hydei TaxID=7224 RepID=A0A6J1LY13_DROHY|nr:cuticle protein 2 [Drosophila hydei]